MDKDKIHQQLENSKIKCAQIDPFGFCNARCWFCPVAYSPNPPDGRSHMAPEIFEKITRSLIEERNRPDGIVDPNFCFLYTAHYNEVLLYKHFIEMMDALRKYNLQTMIFSNGINLTPERVDLIKDYLDVVVGVCLNIPAFEAELWQKRTGFKKERFEQLLENISYAVQQLEWMVYSRTLSIQINGINQNSLTEGGGWITRGENFPPDMDLDPANGELATQKKMAQKLFPQIHLVETSNLVDRAGFLAEQNVFGNLEAIQKKARGDKKEVVQCGNGMAGEGRIFDWLHLNANGDAFLCCQDYNFDFTFGNIKKQSLRELWLSEFHVNTIDRALQTICTQCTFAKWGDEAFE